ncbi:putative ATP-dependent DNA helicase HFM1 [Taenia crassiceps]|uniref:ATP-dependent DNA helicase HFM1 n=1 Tax=Taenia crassiceps TaxID=6207 RepID=A0ABR4QQC6_9CEST
MTEWQDKLKSLGFTCLELTSDSPHYDLDELLKQTLLIATPEKIDSMLRFQEGMEDLLARVELLMVDEFDQFLTKKLLPIIRTYSQGRPTLIFSITRKTVENTAEWLARGSIMCPNIRQELLDNISSSLLKECLSRGVGFHHAGISATDRRLVEEAYLEGCISVLELCLDALDKLKSVGALKLSTEGQTIVPYRRLILILYRRFTHLVAGKLMCDHFLSASTVGSFFCLTGSETLVDLIHFVAGCTEMHEISIRNQEKGQLNLINRASGIQRLRYPTKGRITTPQMKVVTLLQAELNDFVVLEAGLQQESNKALKIFTRCSTGLRNLLWGTTSSGIWEPATPAADNPPSPATMGFACMTHVIELAKVANYRVWADAPLASLRQLPDVGRDYVNQLAGAGVVSLKDIERLGPRTLERILNRKPPFGDRVYESVLGIPKYELAAEQVTTAVSECVKFEFTVRLIRSCKFDQVALIVGDDKNHVIFKTVLSTTLIESSGKWSHRIVVHHASGARLLFTSLISFNFLGIDLNINFPIPWPESNSEGTDQGITTTLANISQTFPVTVSPYIPNSPASVTLKKGSKQKTPNICRPRQTKSSTPLFSTPKGACGVLKQANIFAFFKTTELHSERVPEGRSASRSKEISPILKTINLPSTPALNVSAISTPHTQMPSEALFVDDPPSLLPSPPIQTPSEVGPKKPKWDQDANNYISPETDKIVEEELCSFLASVEAAEKDRSGFIHYRQLDYTISPIFPVDMDESCNYTTCLKPTESPNLNASENTSIKSPNKVLENARSKQSPTGFKTPREMQLLTSLDDACESARRADLPIFKVPTSITPLRAPQKTQSSLLTRTPTTTKLPKKVSFSSLLLPKSDSVCCDTGYVSSLQRSTPKKLHNPTSSADATFVKEVTKTTESVFAIQEANEGRSLKRQEMEVLKEDARFSRMLDFQLLREGWDQLATFIYCYSMLEKFDSADAEFVAITAPRTPPHNTTDFTHSEADLHSASAFIAPNAFGSHANSKHKCLHQPKFISEIENLDTGCQHQVEE